MSRWLYIRLLFLHPAMFRYRFGDEMLEIFDNTPGFSARAQLISDGLVSLLRQWVLRGEFHEPEPVTPGDVPVFHTFDPYQPRPAALLNGGVLAMLILSSVVVAIGHGGRPFPFSIGAHRTGFGLLAIDREAFVESQRHTTVTIAPDPDDPMLPVFDSYFSLIPVLRALDANRDRVLSPAEISNAAAVLRSLDVDSDGDGSLSPEECGFASPGNMSADVLARTRREFMRVHPVLAALDTNHDGVISAAEIAAAPVSLTKLDHNRDGYLTGNEILPDPAEATAAVIFARFDRNNDGVLSQQENYAGGSTGVGALLNSADRNHDGVVTRDELIEELRVRSQNSQQLDAARRRSGISQ